MMPRPWRPGVQRLHRLPFNPRPVQAFWGHRSGVLVRAGGLLLMGAGVVTTAIVLWAGWQAKSELTMLQAERTPVGGLHKNAGPHALDATQQAVAALKSADRQRINQMVRRLNAPWRTILEGLEAAYTDQVALVTIEPDMDRRVVRIQVEALALQDLLFYTQRLQGVSGLRDARVLKLESGPEIAADALRMTLEVGVQP